MPFSLPFFKKDTDSEVYFGLFVKEYGAVGMVIERSGDRMKILGRESIIFTSGWETILEQIDELLFSLEQKTGKHLEKVIFFVYSHFVDQTTKDIKKEYLPTFKSILKHLELKPLGYIECYEAVVNHLESRDKTLPTGILVELDKKNISAFVYKAGNKVMHKSTTRTDEIGVDLEALFRQMSGEEMLPSRIIMYDSEDVRDETGHIISHRWEEDLFVQFPRVELLKSDELYDSLVTIFEGQVVGEAHENMGVAEQESSSADISTSKPVEEEEESPKEVMGFAIGEEVKHKPKEEERSKILDARSEMKTPFNEPNKDNKFMAALTPLFSKLPKFAIPKNMPTLPKKSYALWGGGLLLLLTLLFLGEYFFHRATVDVLFPSQTIDKSTVLAANLDGSGGDFTLTSSTLSQDYSEKKATTGKRDEGEKAKGEVTLHNFDDKERLVSKGTTLEAEGVKFVLDEDVKVASSSIATDGSAKLPGKTKGKITAAALGPEGNIAKGTRFKIGDLSTSTHFGINESALSGGTKKQVRTVAKADVDALKEKILEKAKQDATNKIKESSGDEEQVLDTLTESALSKITLSKEVGEEANEVTLKTSVDTKYYTYKKRDIQAYLKNSYDGEVPSGFKLEEDKITFNVENIKKDKTKVSLTVEAQGLALKDVSQPDIAKKLAGKKKSDIDSILKENFQASGSEVTMKAPLFLYNFWVPFFQKNIEIKVSSL